MRVSEGARVVRVRAPYALARALAATAVVLLGALSAHTWAGGTVPSGAGLALVAGVVLAGGLLLFTREVPLWALLPVVAAAQLGLHESFGLVAEHGHHAAMSPAGNPGRTWQMVAAHLFVTVLTAVLWWAGRRAASYVVSFLVRPALPVPTRLRPRPRTRTTSQENPMSHQPSARNLTRLCVLPAATAAIALSLVSPAGAHVSATVSDASAGAVAVATFSVAHGCKESPTTRLEIQVPDSVLSVTPTRNPYYEVEATIEQLDAPVTDDHGNTITEHTSSIVYTARTPLPSDQRDTFELSFQVPDAAGEVVRFPTIQTCEKGETAWTQVPADGQDEEELENPAPSFTILPASGEGDHGEGATGKTAQETAAPASDDTEAASDEEDGDGSSALGWAGLVAGLLGLAAGGLALARTRSTS